MFHPFGSHLIFLKAPGAISGTLIDSKGGRWQCPTIA